MFSRGMDFQISFKYSCSQIIRWRPFTKILNRSNKSFPFRVCCATARNFVEHQGPQPPISVELAEAMFHAHKFLHKPAFQVKAELLGLGWNPEVVDRLGLGEATLEQEIWVKALQREWSLVDENNDHHWTALEGVESTVDLMENACSLFKFRDLLGYWIVDPLYPLGSYKWITYGQFSLLVSHIRSIFVHNWKLKPGSRLVLISRNGPDWAAAAVAAWGIGAVVVPLGEGCELRRFETVLNESRAEAALVSDKEIFDQIASVRDRLSTLKHVAVMDGMTTAFHIPEASLTFLLQRARSVEGPVLPLLYRPKRDEEALVTFSAGQGNAPVIAVHTHGALLAASLAADLVFKPCQDQNKTVRSWLSLQLLHGKGPSQFGRAFFNNDEDKCLSISLLQWGSAGGFGLVAEFLSAVRRGGKVAVSEGRSSLLSNMQEVRPFVLFLPGWALDELCEKAGRIMLEEVWWRPALINFVFALDWEWISSTSSGRFGVSPPGSWIQRAISSLVKRLILKPLGGGRLRLVVCVGPVKSSNRLWFQSAGIEVLEVFGVNEIIGGLALVKAASSTPLHSILSAKKFLSNAEINKFGSTVLLPLPARNLFICPIYSKNSNFDMEFGELCVKSVLGRSSDSFHKVDTSLVPLGDVCQYEDFEGRKFLRLMGGPRGCGLNDPAFVQNFRLEIVAAKAEMRLLTIDFGNVFSAATVIWTQDNLQKKFVGIAMANWKYLRSRAQDRLGSTALGLSPRQLIEDIPTLSLLKISGNSVSADFVDEGGLELWLAVPKSSDEGALDFFSENRLLLRREFVCAFQLKDTSKKCSVFFVQIFPSKSKIQ